MPDNPHPAQPVSELNRAVVLVGLMGAGKSCVGRRLAQRMNVPFVDADTEIETAAGCSITDIFERYGEAAFRDGERRVMARLLTGEPMVLATGGGAFIDPDTRSAIKEHGISVWLRADLETLIQRTAGRNNRPLLNTGDSRETLVRLMDERYPIYNEADIIVDSGVDSPNITCGRVYDALSEYFAKKAETEQ